jgi:hypothetical protein
MRLTSSAFGQQERIPTRYTCEGENISPELQWEEAPPRTKTFTLILHDPDAPRMNGFTHWMLYNIPSGITHLPENVPEGPRVSGLGLQGKNDAGKIGYIGPCPPSGSHRYFLRLFALSIELDLDPAASAQELQTALHDHIIEQAELMGTYAKLRAKSA